MRGWTTEVEHHRVVHAGSSKGTSLSPAFLTTRKNLLTRKRRDLWGTGPYLPFETFPKPFRKVVKGNPMRKESGPNNLPVLILNSA